MRKNTGIEYGNLRKIALMTGYSYTFVRKVIVYGDRKNEKIMAAANAIAESNKKVELIIQEMKVA